MCKYCKEPENEQYCIFEKSKTLIPEILSAEIYSSYDKKEGNFGVIFALAHNDTYLNEDEILFIDNLHFQYCPMCGRKL